MRRGVIAALFTTAVGVSACAAYDEFAIAADRGAAVQDHAATVDRDAQPLLSEEIRRARDTISSPLPDFREG